MKCDDLEVLTERSEGTNWTRNSDKKPTVPGDYLVSGGGKVWVCKWIELLGMCGGWSNSVSNPCVEAWMPLPKPYRNGGIDNDV